MTKTPEQDKGCVASQLAEEYCNTKQLSYVERLVITTGYIDGYQAAMNSPEKQDSCEHILDMEKMVDVNPSSGWISVKERLPETNELCIVNTEWRSIVPALYGNESWIFDEGQGWSEKALSYVSHWMPLPKPPEEI